jgi:hypothetical protein
VITLLLTAEQGHPEIDETALLPQKEEVFLDHKSTPEYYVSHCGEAQLRSQ